MNAELPAAPEDFHANSQRACAWPRRPKQGPVRMITPEELRSWIIHEDARLLVVAKPGDAVCHPSKAGPWSSLVGAVREYTGLPVMHLVFRLDRETSGVVVLAKDAKMASRLQTAMQERKVGKIYSAILTGELAGPVTVDQPLGDDTASAVFVKSAVRADGQAAVTHFTPVKVARMSTSVMGDSQSNHGSGDPCHGEIPTGLAALCLGRGRDHPRDLLRAASAVAAGLFVPAGGNCRRPESRRRTGGQGAGVDR